MIVERTKTGLPALWERGGGMTNTGEATIIAGPNGERLTPIYVRRWGSLSNEHHALFVVQPGCLVVTARHHRGDYETIVSRIDRIDGDEAILIAEYHWSHGEWDFAVPDSIMAAVYAAEGKAVCYHCREPHYALPMPDKQKNIIVGSGNEPAKQA